MVSAIPTEDEDISPSLENTVVLLWLKLVHKDLPWPIKQRYGTELRSRTLASIKPEISQALESLLNEIHTSEDVKIMRSASFQRPSQQWRKSGGFSQTMSRPRASHSSPSCPLCKQASCHQFSHYLSSCPNLPESDHRFMSRARMIAAPVKMWLLSRSFLPLSFLLQKLFLPSIVYRSNSFHF